MVYPKFLSKRMHPPSRTVASVPRPPTTKETVPRRRGNEYPRFLLEDGARRPPSYLKYALFVLSAFARPTEVCLVLLNESGKAHHSRTVVSVPRPPTTKETVPRRRGNEYPRFLLEDGARRPPSYLKYALFVLSAFARPTEVCLVLLNESGCNT